MKRQRSSPEADQPQFVTISDDDDDVVEVIGNAPAGSAQSNQVLEEPKKYLKHKTVQLSKPILRCGDKVYAIDRGLKAPWFEGTIECIEQRYGRYQFKIKFSEELRRSKRKATKRKVDKYVSTAHIAYFDPPTPSLLFTGIRVIARTLDEKGSSKTHFYVGTIAEPPSAMNKNRVLVFFDDGYAAYCPIEDIRLTASSEPGASSWIECHPEIQEFIETYIRLYPEHIIKATLRPNAITSVEWNGMWWAARVLEVDCSMAKVELLSNSFRMKIWRGSNRFFQVYARTRTRANRNFKVQPNIEFEGKIQIERIPSKYLTNPRPYVTHTCRKSCATAFGGSCNLLKGVSPLAIPLYHGWKREIENTAGKPIVYVAPCGMIFRELNEIQKFLSKTFAPFGIDSFDFSFNLNCMEEFGVYWPAKTYIPDISKSQEKAPISLINTVDYMPPPDVIYSVKRLPRPSVKINYDPEFLSCCDCTDDCQDRSKCTCQRITMESVKNTYPTSSEEDLLYQLYHHRRLYRKVSTGIFECNSKCRCSQNCVNRLVQLGIKFKLQVFKTQTKGYAVRTLQDIPEGSFIAVYTGEILTSAEANDDGTKHGDEYLANMDLIEAAENHKPGYEAEVVEKYPLIEEIKKKRGRKKKNTRGAKAKPKKVIEEDPVPQEKNPTRKLFGDEEEIYAIDAKRIGNVGRYFNHSCDPNVFVQDVFLDTHDVRFPWVAMFSSRFIKCGTELTWDYNYEIGMAPGKEVLCDCASLYCRRRLL